MPTYEYACKKCGEHLEAFQSFSEDPLTVCPSCGGELRKVFGSVGIVFKGSGFYKTDSRSGAKSTTRPEKEPASAGAASTSSSAEPKGETKAAPAAESKPAAAAS